MIEEDKKESEALSQNKLLLSHDILKLIAAFLKDNASDVVGMEVHLTTARPTMTMTEDGKCHTGRTVLCTVNTWADPDDDDDFDDD